MSKKTGSQKDRIEQSRTVQNVLTAISDKVNILDKNRVSDTYLSITIAPPEIRTVANIFKGTLDDTIGETIVGVDLQDNRYELIYYFWSLARGVMFEVRTQVKGDAPTIDSIAEIYPGLDWHEREIHEMFGITFIGHPNLGLLILPDELEGKYPLRKSFQVSRDRLKESGIAGTATKPAKASQSPISPDSDKTIERE